MRNALISAVTGLTLVACVSVQAGDDKAASMTITRNGEQASRPGPDKLFTGRARIDALFGDEPQSDVTAAYVTFEPGARSNWHTHPAGQFLVVTSGQGWVQQDGGKRQVINPGDVVWTPPGVRHWHGASDSVGMKHMAIQAAKDGEVVKWQEPVSDEQYGD